MIGQHNVQAVSLALSSTLILSLTDNYVSAVSEEAGLWQFQVVRALFALPILVLGALYLGISLKPKNLKTTLIRSVMVSSGLLIYFAALGFLPVAQAGAGLFSSPIWVLLLSILLFGQRVSIWQIVVMVTGFVGVLMLLQPDTENLTLLLLFPLAAGALYGLGMLVTRQWCASETAATMVIGVFSIIGLVSLVMLVTLTLLPSSAESPSYFMRGWEPLTLRFIWLTFMQAVGAIVAVLCITQAYRLGQASLVAAFEYSFLVFAAFWAWLLWGSSINLQASAGIVVILVSGAVFAALSRE